MKRKADFILQNVGGERLLVPIGAQVINLNGLMTLNDTAAFLWNFLENECNLDELSDAVVAHFDVAPEVARADIQMFLGDIIRLGILEQEP